VPRPGRLAGKSVDPGLRVPRGGVAEQEWIAASRALRAALPMPGSSSRVLQERADRCGVQVGEAERAQRLPGLLAREGE
jgi:hypothetical protein